MLNIKKTALCNKERQKSLIIIFSKSRAICP